MNAKIKVTDKRMFTAEGEIREDLRDQEVGADQPGDRPDPKQVDEPPRVEPARVEPKTPEMPLPKAAASEPPLGRPREPARRQPGTGDGDLPAPTFVDLIGLLAQPIAMFLGDTSMPGGEAEENLPLARFHIDLLDLVQSKTKGNINSEEAKLLEDLLFQLRMRYVEKVG